ncbi:MAG: hypothetical protein AB7F31_04370 [Parachlamydiales bacterium]
MEITLAAKIFPYQQLQKAKGGEAQFNKASGELKQLLQTLCAKLPEAKKLLVPIATLDRACTELSQNLKRDGFYELQVGPCFGAFRKLLRTLNTQEANYPKFADFEKIEVALFRREIACESIWTASLPNWAGNQWFHDILRRDLDDSDPFILRTLDLLIELDALKPSVEQRKSLGSLEGYLTQVASLVAEKAINEGKISAVWERNVKRALLDAKELIANMDLKTRLTQRVCVLMSRWSTLYPAVKELLTIPNGPEKLLSDPFASRKAFPHSPLLKKPQRSATALPLPPTHPLPATPPSGPYSCNTESGPYPCGQ